jgi:hypothetical protein
MTSPSSSSNEAVYASAFARKTKSAAEASGSTSRRTTSRKRRFRRLRRGVEFPDLGTTIATRGCDRGEDNARTSRNFVRARFPSRITSRSSALRVRRCVRGNARFSGAGVFRWKFNGQALSALFSAPTQGFSSPTSGHPSTKTVGLHTALITGTICRFSHARASPTRLGITRRQNAKPSLDRDIGQAVLR